MTLNCCCSGRLQSREKRERDSHTMPLQGMRASLVLVLLTAMHLFAQSPLAVTAPQGLPHLRDVSTEEYRQHLDQLRGLVADCGRVVTACDPAKVGSDDRVHPAQGNAYAERYGWLRRVLDDQDTASRRLRAELLPRAEQRLSEQEEELGHATVATPLTQRERTQRDQVFAAKEFQVIHEYSWRERLSAWISEKLARLFGGAASLGRAAPWLGKALEWGCLFVAVTLLVLWVYRTLDRQRISLGTLTGDAARREAMEASRAWAELAQAHAAAGEWRDAVHCVYWATVVLLEERRTFRRNDTRTPREALQLITVSSELRAPLHAQTAALERIWYGFADATEVDYDDAMQNYRQVQGTAARAA